MQNQFKKLLYLLVILFIGISINVHSQESFVVNTIYFRPTDAPPIEKMKDDIIKWMKGTQDFYRSEMIRNGFGSKTFKLKRLANNDIKIYIINGKHNEVLPFIQTKI